MRCLIYTYGSHQRGMGHIYQSMALADALEAEGARVEFVVPDHPAGLEKLGEGRWPLLAVPRHMGDAERIAYIDARLEGEVDLALLDILESGDELAEYWAGRAGLLAALDEIGPGRRHADLLVNVIHRPPRPDGATYTEINRLDHVILRPEFALAGTPDSCPDRVGRILVSQGGSDTFGGLVHLVGELAAVPADVEVDLVVGPAFEHDGPLAQATAAAGRPFNLRRDVRDMAGLMRRCDLAVSGGGKTLFELAALGIPFVAVTEEPRELETMDIVARDVLCENIGLRRRAGGRVRQAVLRLLDDPRRRLEMRRSGHAAVGGSGARRVAGLLLRAGRQRMEESRALGV